MFDASEPHVLNARRRPPGVHAAFQGPVYTGFIPFGQWGRAKILGANGQKKKGRDDCAP